MKKIILLITFTLATSFSVPKKVFYPYAIAISESELIIDGKISNINSNEYEFEISDFIKGKSSKKVNVKIWEEWTCDARVGNLEKGQRLVLFLNKTEDQTNCYNVFNGSTGELFVFKNDSVETFMTKSFPEVKELKKGIEMFQNAFKFYGDLNKIFDEERYFKKLIDQEEIDEMKEENKFFKYIIEEELKHYKVS